MFFEIGSLGSCLLFLSFVLIFGFYLWFLSLVLIFCFQNVVAELEQRQEQVKDRGLLKEPYHGAMEDLLLGKLLKRLFVLLLLIIIIVIIIIKK